MIDEKSKEIEEILFTYKDYCTINKTNKYADIIVENDDTLYKVTDKIAEILKERKFIK